MELLDQRLKNIERLKAIFSHGDVYLSLSSSSFTQKISKTELSSRFALPKFELYDGTTDPTINYMGDHSSIQPSKAPTMNEDEAQCVCHPREFCLFLFLYCFGFFGDKKMFKFRGSVLLWNVFSFVSLYFMFYVLQLLFVLCVSVLLKLHLAMVKL